MQRDVELRMVESIGMLPASQRTPAIVAGLLPSAFVESHPTLVRMLSDPDMDVAMLKMVLDRIGLVRGGHNDVHDASVEVGNALAATYFPNGRE